MKKEKNLNIRISPADREVLNKVAAELDISASQIAREAIKEKVVELNEKIQKESEIALAQ